MTPERRKFVGLSVVCVMLACAFFSLRRFPYHRASELTFFALSLVSVYFQYNSNRRQPDAMTRLFSAPPENLKEIS